MHFKWLFFLFVLSFQFSICQFRAQNNLQSFSKINKETWLSHHLDSLFDSIPRSSNISKRLIAENWIVLSDTNYTICVNPLFSFAKGNNIWENTRGGIVQGKLGNKLFIKSDFQETQSRNPISVSNYIESHDVYPALGRTRPFGDNGYDYAVSSANIVFKLNPMFTFDFGYDRHFIGNGVRSVIMDNSNFPASYFEITTQLGKITYHNLYAKYNDISNRLSPTEGFANKFGSFQYLEWNVFKDFSLGLFQGIIQGNDSLSNRNVLDINYWNPILFMRPVEFAMGSPDNALIGLDINYIFKNKVQTYGQFLIDDINVSELVKRNGFFQNKFAHQLGIKFKDNIGSFRLAFGYEYNQVRPYVYAHKYPIQAYSHHGESLGHQLGANFKENIIWTSVDYKKNHLVVMLDIYKQGVDIDTSYYGSNIFVSDFDAINGEFSSGNELLQGQLKSVSLITLNYYYLLSETNNMRIGFKVRNRMESIIEIKRESHLSIYFSANIFNDNEIF